MISLLQMIIIGNLFILKSVKSVPEYRQLQAESYMLICRNLAKIWLCLLMICCFMSMAKLTTAAQHTDDAKIVRVGYFENEIFQEGAKEGVIKKGYAYDYYRKLSEYTGWRYEYIYGNFVDLYNMLLNGQIDMLAGLAKNDERSKIIGYPDIAMGNETYNIVKHGSDTSITTAYSTLTHKRIGVLESAMAGVLRQFLKQHGITATVITYPDYQNIFEAFDKYSIDAFVAESDGAAYGKKNAELLYSFGSSAYYLCVSAKRQDLLDELNMAQARLILEEPNYINSLRIRYYSKSISSRFLSEMENEWLAKNHSLRVGYLNNYLPYSDTDKDGNVTGMIHELIPEIIASLEIKDLHVTYTGYDKYTDMISDVRNGKLDVVFPVGGGGYFSEEDGIYQLNPVISTTTELIYRGEYSDRTPTHFAVNKNNRMQYYYIRTNFPDADVTFYNSIEDCLDNLLKGKVTCTTLNGIRANDILKNRRYRDLSMKRLNRNDDRSFGVRIGNEGLLKLLNRGLNLSGEDIGQRLAYKYVAALYTYTFLDMVFANIWLFALIIIAITFLMIVFFARESSNTKKQMLVKEAARKELEEKNKELAAAISGAESANKAKSYFLSTMSHDIRTPLNSILSMNEMVLRECDNENILIYSGHIRSSGNTLLGLINDILDFSKIEAGKLEIIPVDYQISSVLNDLVNMLQTKTEEKGLSLELDIDREIPNYLHGDEIRIKQAVTNLLTNATKYTKEGTVSFRVGYEKLPEDSEVILLKVSVSDTGIGIKKEDVGRLFEAFERLDELGNRKIEGTGLGIPITQKLLNLMGSTLCVESEYGKGSCFSFSVKQKVIKWDAVGDYKTAFRRSVAERKKYTESFTAPEACILVVDDTPVNLTVVKSLLKRTKLKIDTANSADECIECAMRKKYDLIFLDHMMPYKDGIEALRELKAMPDNPNVDTPMICLTANAISGMRDTYIAAGFDDYLTKPIDPSNLEETIIQYLPPEKIIPASATDTHLLQEVIPEFVYQIEEIDVTAGLKHCGSPEAYLEALHAYTETVMANSAEIAAFWKERDIQNVTVKIHGLKSTARVIGALSLSTFAQQLEKAGQERDVKTLEDNIDKILADNRALGEKLMPIAKSETAAAEKPMLSEEELANIYLKLQQYLEGSDYDAIEALGEDLEGYQVPERERERVEKIKKAISMLDYDEIPALLERKK